MVQILGRLRVASFQGLKPRIDWWSKARLESRALSRLLVRRVLIGSELLLQLFKHLGGLGMIRMLLQ